MTGIQTTAAYIGVTLLSAIFRRVSAEYNDAVSTRGHCSPCWY